MTNTVFLTEDDIENVRQSVEDNFSDQKSAAYINEAATDQRMIYQFAFGKSINTYSIEDGSVGYAHSHLATFVASENLGIMEKDKEKRLTNPPHTKSAGAMRTLVNKRHQVMTLSYDIVCFQLLIGAGISTINYKMKTGILQVLIEFQYLRVSANVIS